MSYVTLPCILNGTARYVRFKAFRRDLPFHDWLFIDEIVVNYKYYSVDEIRRHVRQR